MFLEPASSHRGEDQLGLTDDRQQHSGLAFTNWNAKERFDQWEAFNWSCDLRANERPKKKDIRRGHKHWHRNFLKVSANNRFFENLLEKAPQILLITNPWYPGLEFWIQLFCCLLTHPAVLCCAMSGSTLRWRTSLACLPVDKQQH